jgi:hypothetical protein
MEGSHKGDERFVGGARDELFKVHKNDVWWMRGCERRKGDVRMGKC